MPRRMQRCVVDQTVSARVFWPAQNTGAGPANQIPCMARRLAEVLADQQARGSFSVNRLLDSIADNGRERLQVNSELDLNPTLTGAR